MSQIIVAFLGVQDLKAMDSQKKERVISPVRKFLGHWSESQGPRVCLFSDLGHDVNKRFVDWIDQPRAEVVEVPRHNVHNLWRLKDQVTGQVSQRWAFGGENCTGLHFFIGSGTRAMSCALSASAMITSKAVSRRMTVGVWDFDSNGDLVEVL